MTMTPSRGIENFKTFQRMTNDLPTFSIRALELCIQPRPIWIVAMPKPDIHQKIPFDWIRLFMDLDPSRGLIRSTFRCVNFSRIEQVIENGVDVTPIDHEIYTTTFFDKAWEYGEWPKLALAFDQNLLE